MASENDDKFILLSLLLLTVVVSVAIGEEKDEKSEVGRAVVDDDVLRCSPSRSGSSNDALLFVGSRLLLL